MKDWLVALLIITAVWGIGFGLLDGDLATFGNWLRALAAGVVIATVRDPGQLRRLARHFATRFARPS
jgi:hypothetical protein